MRNYSCASLYLFTRQDFPTATFPRTITFDIFKPAVIKWLELHADLTSTLKSEPVKDVLDAK